MASALPKRDVSVTWSCCARCRTTHAGTAPCPRPGYWLVAGTKVTDPYPLPLLGTRVQR